MASRLTVLYYDGSKWVELKNRETNAGFDSENATTPSNKPYFYSGGSPVLAMELEDLQGAPLQIKLTLNNRQNKPRGTFTEPNNSYTFGEDPLVNPQVPQFHGLLAEFTRLMVFEADTYMTLFVGRVLKREETYDLARGSTLTLTCRDALHELTKNSPFQYAQGQQILTFRNYPTFEESGSPYTTLGVLETRNHYHIIKKLIEQTSFANSTGNIEIGFTDTDKIESWTTAPRIRNWAEDSVRIDSQNGFFLNKVRSKNTLTEIQDQASAEVWALGANKMGFTFHLDATRVDPRLQASGATLLPQQDFTYARRGYKSTSNTTTQALSVKYAVNPIDEAVTLTTTDKTRNMLQDGYEFEAHGNPFMSHLILTYPHTKELSRDKPGGNNPKGADGLAPKFANYFDWDGTPGQRRSAFPSPRYWDASDPDAAINGYTWDMYDVLGIDPESDEEVEETLAFTLLYVQPYDSNDNELEDFSIDYADGDISQTWPNSAVSSGHLRKFAAGKYKGRTFHQVSSLHTKIGPMGRDIGAAEEDETPANIQQVFTSVNEYPFYNYGTKTWIGNVQIQGKDEEGNHYIIISHPQEDVIRTLTAGQVLYERSHYYEMDHSGTGTSNPRGAKIKFVSYPAADKGWKQTLKVNSPKAPYQELRNRIENQFLKANNKVTKRVRSGTFRIKDYPHITRKGTAGLLSTGSTLYPSESFSGGVTPAYYGMKRGCAVQRTSGHADKYVGYIGTVNAANVVASLWKEDTLANASPVVGSWAPGDTYSISVPLRAGDSIRVENLLLGIAGNFLIESIYYSWANGQVYSEVETIGMNDLVVFKSRSSTDLDNDEMISELVDPITIEKTALASGAYSAKGVLWWHDNEYETTPSEVSNPLKKDYNTFSWSGGSIIIHSGRKKTYIFKAGDTDEALVRAGLTTFNDSTDPGAPSPANTCMGPNTQYILYLDRKGTVDSEGRYSLNIDVVDHSDFGYSKADSYIELAYMHIGTLEDAGSKTIGKPGTSFYSRTIDFPKGIPNIQFLYVFDNTWGLSSNIMNPGFSFNKNSMTSALLKPGARPWASNISIRAHTNENYNQIMWDNGSANGASTLTYGDATSISIAAGAKTTGLDDNRTYYMYIDTGASTTPQFTESHATATGDAQLLLALIVVGDDTNQTAPTILPFNSKVPTLNAVAIAANAIIADHIQAGQIATNKLTVEAQGDITEKTRTHVGGSAPSWTPRTYDIWFDTDPQPTVIKVWDGDSWEVRNSNAPEGGGATVFYAATNSPPSSLAVNDIWYATDTDIAYIAVTHVASSIQTSTQWVKQDVVTAINSASTEIKGGLINTAKIILTANGGNILEEGTGTSPSAARIELGNTEIAGYSTTGDANKEFYITASTGKGYFADGAVTLDGSGLTIDSSSSTNKFIQFSKAGETISNAAFMYRYISGSTDELHLGKVGGYPVRIIGHLLPRYNVLSNLGDISNIWGGVHGQTITAYLRYLAPYGQQAAPTYAFNTQTGMFGSSTSINFSVLTKNVFKVQNTSAGTTSFTLMNASGVAKVYGYGSSGNLHVAGNLYVDGAVSKGSGSFMIDHPLDDDKYLLHGFVESPRYDLIYRGKATLSSGTVTANIDTDSDMSDGTYVALTKNNQVWVQNKTGWAAVKGSIQGNQVVITCQDDTSTDEVDWLVVAERNDAFIKSDVDINTDSEGTFIPEQLKIERNAKFEPPPEPYTEED